MSTTPAHTPTRAPIRAAYPACPTCHQGMALGRCFNVECLVTAAYNAAPRCPRCTGLLVDDETKNSRGPMLTISGVKCMSCGPISLPEKVYPLEVNGQTQGKAA